MERKFRITVNGREYEVTVEELFEDSSHLLPQPGDMRVPPPAPPPAAPAPEPSPETGPGELPSPLAGVVHAVEVAVGDRVQKGQTLVVIDSMKMKTSIVASHAGTVTHVFVEPGASVDGGQALLRVE